MLRGSEKYSDVLRFTEALSLIGSSAKRKGFFPQTKFVFVLRSRASSVVAAALPERLSVIKEVSPVAAAGTSVFTLGGFAALPVFRRTEGEARSREGWAEGLGKRERKKNRILE